MLLVVHFIKTYIMPVIVLPCIFSFYLLQPLSRNMAPKPNNHTHTQSYSFAQNFLFFFFFTVQTSFYSLFMSHNPPYWAFFLTYSFQNKLLHIIITFHFLLCVPLIHVTHTTWWAIFDTNHVEWWRHGKTGALFTCPHQMIYIWSAALQSNHFIS